jgi:hypothetical protein
MRLSTYILHILFSLYLLHCKHSRGSMPIFFPTICISWSLYCSLCPPTSPTTRTLAQQSTISLISKVVQSHELFNTSLLWFYWCKACANVLLLLNSRLNICMMVSILAWPTANMCHDLYCFLISIYCQVLPIYKAWSMVLATGTLWKMSEWT